MSERHIYRSDAIEWHVPDGARADPAAVEAAAALGVARKHDAQGETFGEFLESRRGKLGVNFGCYVGHSNLRRWVMGEDASTRAATPNEVEEMRVLLRDAMAAGAAGFSSSAAPTHLDLGDRPVPSRLSEQAELETLAEEAGGTGAGSIAYLPANCSIGEDLGPVAELISNMRSY